MNEFYAYRGFCLCALEAAPPQEAVKVEAPFSPLCFLLKRDPCVSRGFFAVDDVSELYEGEGVNLLAQQALPKAEPDLASLSAFVHENGAIALNTAFSRAYSVLAQYRLRRGAAKRLTLVGLGDVGGTLLTGLKLLGEGLEQIAVYDPNAAQCERYEAELNQVLPLNDGAMLPKIVICEKDTLFDCDALLFTASRGVPGLNAKVNDVRMAQYEANREMLAAYAKQARDTDFCGMFCQISDPVDQLSRAVFLESNRENGVFDANGLLPEQVQGFGLGVMRARALYYAQKRGADAAALCAYGPHGSGLVVANAPDAGYDDALSCALTEEALHANLRIRALGFKPYIAPGLSSACVSVLRMLRGQWHDGAVSIGGAYFGCTSRMSENGLQIRRRTLCAPLFKRLEESWRALRDFE